MYTVGDVYRAIDAIAPFHLAKDGDNVGLLIGSRGKVVGKALLAMDATPQVLEEAVNAGADLIITHHPVIYTPLSSISAGHIVYGLIRHDVAIISAHTNLDIAHGGVNDCLARRIGLGHIRPLDVTASRPYSKVMVFVPLSHAEEVYGAMAKAGGGHIGNYSGCAFFSEGTGRFLPGEHASPFIGTPGKLETAGEVKIEMIIEPDKLGGLLHALKQAHPYEEPAYDVLHNYAIMHDDALGRVGELASAMEPEAFAAHVKSALSAGGVAYTAGEHMVQTVAVCGGSGGGYVAKAQALGAQALVVGESRHSQRLEAAAAGITLVDAGHFTTETVVLEPFMQRLQKCMPGISLQVAGTNADPVKYL